MELCPKCKKMTAEKNHYTGGLVCNNRRCRFTDLDIRDFLGYISRDLFSISVAIQQRNYGIAHQIIIKAQKELELFDATPDWILAIKECEGG